MIITLCSTDIIWEDKKANFTRLDELLERIPTKSDVIVLPEMFSTGFTMNTSLAEDVNGESLGWLRKTAARLGCAIVASLPFYEKKGEAVAVYNRAFFVFPSGAFRYYDKRHLFRMGKETQFYTSGQERTVVEYLGVKFALTICYDLRFPVWSRNTPLAYDVLINVANFPVSRLPVIEPLVKARAIENMAYAVFANRTGRDPECEYVPSSLFVDYKGNVSGTETRIAYEKGTVQVIQGTVEMDKLKEFREKFPAWMDADEFKLQ